MPAATRVLCCSCSLLPAYNLRSITNAYRNRFGSGRPGPSPRRPDEPSDLLSASLSVAPPPFLCLASSVAASQPFGHPCRASRLDSLDLSFVLSHRRGYSPPRSDREKRATFGRNSLRKSPTNGPSRPVSACWFRARLGGPLVRAASHPRNAALLQSPFFFRRRRAAGRILYRLPLANKLPRPPAGQPAPLRSTGKDTPILRIRNARSPVSARANGCFYPRLWM